MLARAVRSALPTSLRLCLDSEAWTADGPSTYGAPPSSPNPTTPGDSYEPAPEVLERLWADGNRFSHAYQRLSGPRPQVNQANMGMFPACVQPSYQTAMIVRPVVGGRVQRATSQTRSHQATTLPPERSVTARGQALGSGHTVYAI